MKLIGGFITMRESLVAPFAGAWIEILRLRIVVVCLMVAPFAGAWIEILFSVM